MVSNSSFHKERGDTQDVHSFTPQTWHVTKEDVLEASGPRKPMVLLQMFEETILKSSSFLLLVAMASTPVASCKPHKATEIAAEKTGHLLFVLSDETLRQLPGRCLRLWVRTFLNANELLWPRESCCTSTRFSLRFFCSLLPKTVQKYVS